MEFQIPDIVKYLLGLLTAVLAWLAKYFVSAGGEKVDEAEEGRAALHKRINKLDEESRARDNALEKQLRDLSKQMHRGFVREDRLIRMEERLETALTNLDQKIESRDEKIDKRLHRIVSLLTNRSD